MKHLFRRLAGMMAPVLLALFLPLSAFAAEAPDGRVFDDAGLFTEEEIADLEERIADMTDHTGLDMVVLTTNDTGGKTTVEYADDFYDYNGFGVGNKNSGFIYIIDMNERLIEMTSLGGANQILSDSNYDKILDRAYDKLGNGNYAASAVSVINDIDNYYDDAMRRNWSYNKKTGEWSRKKTLSFIELFIAFFAALVAAMIPYKNTKNQYAMKNEKKLALGAQLAYRAAASFVFAAAADQLLNKSTTTRIIPRAQRSSGSSSGSGPFGHTTTHTSSSGRSHGGGHGGRRF